MLSHLTLQPRLLELHLLLEFKDSTLSNNLKNELADNTVFLALIDGLDEKKLDLDEQLRYLQLLGEGVKSTPNVKVILTSRPLKAFDDSAELDSSIATYMLQPLSFRKSLELISQICKTLNISSRIAEDLKKSVLFRELPKNPIAMILLANLLNENRQEIPSNLTELYSKYTEFALGRWDLAKGFQQQKEYEALQRIMMRLAVFIIENDLRFVSVSESKEFFEDFLGKRNLDLSADELFELMMERTEIMMYSSDKKSIAFKHKTFAEFLYAKLAREEIGLEINNRAFQPYWMNTFFFFLGLMKDSRPILQQLIQIKPDTYTEEVVRVFNMADFMLAGYLSPYDVITEGVETIAVEASRLYQKVVSGETDTFLARLPRMHVLWLFQMLLRGSYGYDFFRPAIESAALEIALSDIDEKTKAYSLFFLNVIYMDLTKDQTFHYLLENTKDMPLDISLAYLTETSDVRKRTDLMKRTDRRIRKSLRGSRTEIIAINKLYDDPIKSFQKLAKGV